MLTKLLSFFIVYILTLVNFAFVLLPFSVLLIFNNKVINRNFTLIFYLFVFIASFLMLVLLIFNYLFDSTVKKYKKTCVNCLKEKEKFRKLLAVFDDEKDMFGAKNTCLLIQNTKTINAYAVGGLRENCIIITTGIMELCKKHSENEIEYYRLLSGIIGHELSHIINKDFFPSLLIIINEKVSRVMSFIIYIILNILSKLVSFIPYIGVTMATLFIKLYMLIKYFMNFFYKNVFIPFYRFIQLQINKNIEYRADEQGARYCGGDAMSKTLSLLGKNGFFTIFSAHPKTIYRMRRVKHIEQCNDYIKPVCFTKMSILFSFLILVYFTIFSYKLINFGDFYLLYDFLNSFVRKIKMFCENFNIGFAFLK